MWNLKAMELNFLGLFKVPVLFQNFPGDTEENCEHPHCD